MRKLLTACAFALLATSSFAASPFFLDRCGTLWKGTSTADGLLLTGEVNGQVQVSSLVPFVVGLDGNQDTQIQVAADELTGKVAVVWQRTFAEGYSEIYAAVWSEGSWERIATLTGDFSENPRFPLISLTQVSSTIPDPAASDDPTATLVIRDSFLHVVWWQGSEYAQHGSYAVLRLTATGDDADAVTTRSLDSLIPVGMGCAAPAPSSVLEHPLFATGGSRDRTMVFFGSRRVCLLNLAEVSFELAPAPPVPDSGPTVEIQRRRHVPIFGVRQLFQTPETFNMENARLILGSDLRPVAYRVEGDRIEYVVDTEQGWSAVRELPIRNGLSLDQAIPLVENLAR
jgi:hypothetical protein